MSWQTYSISRDGTHHTRNDGSAAYEVRFVEVLKFHAPGLAPVLGQSGAWHITETGSAAYAQRFQRTFGFYEGLAAVQSKDGWYHVTPDGNAAYAERYAWCGNFQGGRCPVRAEDGVYAHIGGNGRLAYPQRWRYAGDYRDGVAVVQGASGLSTHIDLEGNLLHNRWLVDLDVFHKGYARARDEDGWLHVDARGHAAYTARFASVEPFYNGQARVEQFDGALDVIDEQGQIICRLREPRRSEFAALSASLVGFWSTQTIATAVQLGIPAALPASVAHVSAACGLSGDGALRLLHALGELELCARTGGDWALTDRGQFLRPGHPQTLADAALEYAGPLSEAWRALPSALSSATGWSPPDVFGEVAADCARRQAHHRMLQSYATHDYQMVAAALNVRPGERVVDAAGGTGTLAKLVLDDQPGAEVSVLDLSDVVALGAAENPDAPVRWIAGDLFQGWAVEADLVLLARVLHDWDDADALRILQRASEALAPGGRIVIVEMLRPAGGHAGALCDLHLLAVTGGRERTSHDLERLVNGAGLRISSIEHIAALPSLVTAVRR